MPIEKNNDLPAGNIDIEVESMIEEDMPDIEIVLDPETGSVDITLGAGTMKFPLAQIWPRSLIRVSCSKSVLS